MEYDIDPAIYAQMEKQRQDQDPNSMYADYMREEKINNIIQQLNPDNLVEDIEHRIRGEKKNRFTKDWEPIPTKFSLFLSDKINIMFSRRSYEL